MFTNEIANEATKFDWSSVIAGIALLFAIISPIITSLINNRSQQQLKKLEFNQTRRIDAFENYLKCAAICLNSQDKSAVNNYESARANLYLFIDSELRKEIDTKSCMITGSGFGETGRKTAFCELSNKVADYYASVSK